MMKTIDTIEINGVTYVPANYNRSRAETDEDRAWMLAGLGMGAVSPRGYTDACYACEPMWRWRLNQQLEAQLDLHTNEAFYGDRIATLESQLAEARELLLNAMPVRFEAMSVGFTERSWRNRREWLLDSLKGEEEKC